MAEQIAKKNKNLIIGICAVAVVAVIGVIVAIFLTRGGNPQINDNYFVSDDTKYVITSENNGSDDDEFNAIKTHIVYNYSGDNITALKYYYEFADAAAAKANFGKIQESLGQLYKDVEQNDKYVILTSNEEDYEGMTAEDVRQQIEFMKLLEEINFDDSDTTDETIEDTTVEQNIVEEVTE